MQMCTWDMQWNCSICAVADHIVLVEIKLQVNTVELQWLEQLWNHENMYETRVIAVVVVLFYVHGKHLRLCLDGQLTYR